METHKLKLINFWRSYVFFCILISSSNFGVFVCTYINISIWHFIMKFLWTILEFFLYLLHYTQEDLLNAKRRIVHLTDKLQRYSHQVRVYSTYMIYVPMHILHKPLMRGHYGHPVLSLEAVPFLRHHNIYRGVMCRFWQKEAALLSIL